MNPQDPLGYKLMDLNMTETSYVSVKVNPQDPLCYKPMGSDRDKYICQNS